MVTHSTHSTHSTHPTPSTYPTFPRLAVVSPELGLPPLLRGVPLPGTGTMVWLVVAASMCAAASLAGATAACCIARRGSARAHEAREWRQWVWDTETVFWDALRLLATMTNYDQQVQSLQSWVQATCGACVDAYSDLSTRHRVAVDAGAWEEAEDIDQQLQRIAQHVTQRLAEEEPRMACVYHMVQQPRVASASPDRNAQHVVAALLRCGRSLQAPASMSILPPAIRAAITAELQALQARKLCQAARGSAWLERAGQHGEAMLAALDHLHQLLYMVEMERAVPPRGSVVYGSPRPPEEDRLDQQEDQPCRMDILIDDLRRTFRVAAEAAETCGGSARRACATRSAAAVPMQLRDVRVTLVACGLEQETRSNVSAAFREEWRAAFLNADTMSIYFLLRHLREAGLISADRARMFRRLAFHEGTPTHGRPLLEVCHTGAREWEVRYLPDVKAPEVSTVVQA